MKKIILIIILLLLAMSLIGQKDTTLNIKIYPNPVVRELTVEWDSINVGKVSYNDGWG